MSKIQDDTPKTNKSSLFTEDKSKLEWMYKSGSDLLNREEYLLGKSIDRQFEKLDDEEKKQKTLPGVTVPKNHVEHECIPYSIRNYRSAQNDEQVDIQRKILEDPLMSIRQKEMESRRRILENPVKLKELHRLLKKEHESGKLLKIQKKSTKNKKDKHHKKKKKRKERSKSSSSEDEDLDKLLAKKYRQIKEKFGANDGTFNLKDLLGKESERTQLDRDSEERHSKKKTNRESDESSLSEDVSPKRSQYTAKKFARSEQTQNPFKQNNHKYGSMSSRKKSAEKSSDESTSDLRNKPDKRYNRSPRRDIPSERNRPNSNYARKNDTDRRKYVEHEMERNRRKDSNTKQPSAKKPQSKSESDSSSTDSPENDTPPRKNYGLVTASGEKIHLKRSTSKSEVKHDRSEKEKQTQSSQMSKNSKRVRLTSEEREKRVQEMMQNAELREKERKTKVDTYRREYERETNDANNFDKNFINKELHKAMTNQRSVESRLKSNINNIQRSGKAMECNFAKR